MAQVLSVGGTWKLLNVLLIYTISYMFSVIFILIVQTVIFPSLSILYIRPSLKHPSSDSQFSGHFFHICSRFKDRP